MPTSAKSFANLYSLVIFKELLCKHLSMMRREKKVCSQEAKIINILCTCRDKKALLMDFLVIYYNTPQQ